MSLLRAIGLVLLLSGAAWTNTIIVAGLHSSLGVQQSLYFDEDGAPSQAYWVGAIDVTIDNFQRLVFCVDLFTNISLSTYSTQLDFSDTANLKRVGWLLQNELPAITTQAGGAALQLAIWDIATDGGDGFETGSGRVTKSSDAANPTDPTILGMAVNFESLSLGMSSTFGIVYHNFTLSGGTRVQTLMGANINDGGPQPKTPEPTPVILMLTGLALILIGRRHRRKDVADSGTIEPRAEHPDLRCEELAGHPRRRALL